MTKRILLLQTIEPSDVEGCAHTLLISEGGLPEAVAPFDQRWNRHRLGHGFLDIDEISRDRFELSTVIETVESSAELVPNVPHPYFASDVKTPEQEAFVRDLLAVCRHHGFVLGHEDGQGAFTFAPRARRTETEIADDEEWLANMREEP